MDNFTYQQATDAWQRGDEDPSSLSDKDLQLIKRVWGDPIADGLRRRRDGEITESPTPSPKQAASLDVSNFDQYGEVWLSAWTEESINKLMPKPSGPFDREATFTRVREKRERDAVARDTVRRQGTRYDPIGYLMALAQMERAPAGLTDADLAMLTLVDPDIGEDAKTARNHARAQAIGEASSDYDEILAKIPSSLLFVLRWTDRIVKRFEHWISTISFLARDAHARIDAIDRKLDASPPAPTALSAHEQRLRSLEGANFLRFRDQYNPSQTYGKFDAVTTSDGTLWVARGIVPAGRIPGKDDGMTWRRVSPATATPSTGAQLEVATLRSELAALRKEFAARGPVPTYKRVWASDQVYVAGDMVTHSGSMWYCEATTTRAKPGGADTASRAWVLAVKAGRDGRDAR